VWTKNLGIVPPKDTLSEQDLAHVSKCVLGRQQPRILISLIFNFKEKSQNLKLQYVLNNFFKGCWKIYIFVNFFRSLSKSKQ
jgi:hypothetical protein